MTAKIKIALCAALLLGLALSWLLFLAERRNNTRLEKEKGLLNAELSLARQRRQMAESAAREKKTLRPRAGNAAVQKMSAGNQHSCSACFANFEYAVEVKDSKGNWVFADENIFDRAPGRLILTEQFWREVAGCRGQQEKSKPRPARRLKNRVLVVLEPAGPKLEYAYSPVGIRTQRLELGVVTYSALYLDYSFLPISAAAGIGLEARF